MDQNTAENEAYCCKICRGEGNPSNELCHPCKCAGSIKYVHESCLQEWLKATGWQEHPCCEVCKTEYRFQRVHEQRIVSRAELLKMFQTYWAAVRKTPTSRIAGITFKLFVQSFNPCITIFLWYNGWDVSVDLGMQALRGFCIPLFFNLCVILSVTPVAVTYKWMTTEAKKQSSKEHVVTETYYSACALAQHREQAMFGLEDLLSLQHRHSMLTQPLSPTAQNQYKEQLRVCYTFTSDAAAVAGDEQLIRAATDCVRDELPNVTTPPVVRTDTGHTIAQHLQRNLLLIPLPNPWWLVGDIESQIRTITDLCDDAPSKLFTALAFYAFWGYWVVPGKPYFMGRAAWCVERFLNSPDRVRWVLWIQYGSSAALGDPDTLALLHKVFSTVVAWYMMMAARCFTGWLVTSVVDDIVHAFEYIQLTKPQHGMQVRVITVLEVLRAHVCSALVETIGRHLLFWCTYVIYPVILSQWVWCALQRPPFSASMCIILYCGCLWFIFQADWLVRIVRRALLSRWACQTPGVLFPSRGCVLALCADVVQSCILLVLLFASCVVLPIRYGHLISPGATLMLSTDPAFAAAASTSTINNSDAFLLLVHGFCLPVLLFRVPLQTAVCWLVETFLHYLAPLVGLGHILASATPVAVFGPPTRAAAAVDAALPPDTMEISSLVETAPQWSCTAFYVTVEMRVGIWSILREVSRPLSKPSELLLPPFPRAWSERFLIVGQAALLVILFLAGLFVLSSWLLHVPLLVGHCVHTALFGAAGMPLPTVGVFQYCTGAVCCVLAVYVVKGICGEVRRDSTVLDMVCVAGRWLQRAGAVLAVGLLWAVVPTCLVGYLLLNTFRAVFTSDNVTIVYTVWDCGFWGALCMLLVDRFAALGMLGNMELFTAAPDVWRRGLAEFQAECCLRSVVLPVCLMLLDCAVLPYFVARCAGMWFVHSYHVSARLVQCCHLVYLALRLADWMVGSLYKAYLRVQDAMFLSTKLKNYDEV